jgi:hypothetical protein
MYMYIHTNTGGMTPRMSLLGSNISPPVFWPEGVKSAYASNPFDKGIYVDICLYLYICIYVYMCLCMYICISIFKYVYYKRIQYINIIPVYI